MWAYTLHIASTGIVQTLDQGFSTGVPRDVTRGSARDRDWKNKHSFLNMLAKINRSTEKYHSLLKRALTINIGLLFLQFTDHANVPWAVDTIIFMQGFPETWKLFQGFLLDKKTKKGCIRSYPLCNTASESYGIWSCELCKLNSQHNKITFFGTMWL
jgi:hypothetical protein